MQINVPVVDKNQRPLMPTKSSKARRLIKSGKATPFWNKGVFCIRLNYALQRVYIQPIVVGVDPGSKREGFSVKSETHTYLNIQTTTPNWIKKKVETRRNLRRTRRYRKAPYRVDRQNRSRKGIPPSTKARWQWKLRVINWLSKMYPIDTVVVEDIKAKPHQDSRKWNASFSPLEVGKKWFYAEIRKRWRLVTHDGWETYEERLQLGLQKTTNKLSNSFYAHCVDAWVLANMWIGGHSEPDNTAMIYLYPLELHRRNLHKQCYLKGGIRKRQGGTRSEGFKRGSWVKHPRFKNICYVGGHTKGRISLHSLKTGKRICRTAKPRDLELLCYSSWRIGR